MKIKLKNKIISTNAIILKSVLEKSIGLLGHKKFDAIIFKTRFGIHTFGMKEKITVLILDKNKKVVKVKNLNPNKLFFWNPKYSQIIEIRKKVKVKIGDKLNF